MKRGDLHQNTAELDQYGGWTGKKFAATGFFRIEKDERWWLVTPEGNAFLSFGINHLHPHFWKQDYNREAWKKRLGLDNLDSREFAPALKTWFLQDVPSIRLQYGRRTHRVVSRQSPTAIYPLHAVNSLRRYPTLEDRNTRQQFCGCLFRNICLTLRSDGKRICRTCKR